MEPKQRPNASYKLSKPDPVGDLSPEDEKLVFYYNRERRLAKAPEAVRNLFNAPKRQSFNLLRPLIADKPRLILFVTIIIICLVIVVFSLLGFFDSSYSLDGTRLLIQGNKYEQTSIIVVKKTLKKGNNPVYTGAVGVAASPVINSEDEEYPVFYHRIFFTLEPEEEYRFVVPFDSPELILVFQSEKSTLKVKIKPK